MSKRKEDRIQKEIGMIKEKNKPISRENNNRVKEKNLIPIGTDLMLKKTLIAKKMSKELNTGKIIIVMRKNLIDKNHMIIETKEIVFGISMMKEEIVIIEQFGIIQEMTLKDLIHEIMARRGS